MTSRGVIYDTSWGGAKCLSPTQKMSDPGSNPGNYPEGVKRSTGTPHHLVKYHSSPLELAIQILGGVIYDTSWGGAKCQSPCTSTIATASDIAAPFHPPPVAVQHGNQKRAFYMCSGKTGNPTGFAAWWNHLSDGGTCTEFDKVNSAEGDMLLNSSFAPFYGEVRDGAYHSGLLTPPCGQFNPRRIAFPDDRYPILRTLADFGMGVTGLSDRFQRSVDAVNVLAVRVCLVARKMFDLGRAWIIENPPTRSDKTGAFRRFFRVQLAGHASFFTLPCVQELIAYTGALFAHIPMCFFGMPEQKYLTFMYPPYMHAAIQCMEGIRCIHSKHSSVAGGFDSDGQPMGADTGIHPSGCSELLVRACLEPTVPCMLKPMQSTTVLASQDTVASTGFPADRSGVPADAVTRGKQGKQSNMTSRGAHERFHRPSETLRNLHYCTRDIPVSWTKMLDVEQSCDACLRAKAAHQHHSGTLPETTAPGEICAFDLWKTQTASVLGGERDVFGVIDLFSDFSDVTRIRVKD